MCNYEHRNKFAVSINRGKFQDKLSTKYSAERSGWISYYEWGVNSQLHRAIDNNTDACSNNLCDRNNLKTLLKILKKFNEISR